jgi:ADP-ribose pyrophosphatase YjhB (NUDIX family)
MSNDSIGIVGPKIYRFEDQKIVQKPLQQVNILTKKVGARWVPDDTSDYPTTNFSVAKLAGSCLLLKRKAIEDVGVFNENFFLYYADTDLQKRMGQSGWKLYNIPHSVILHKHSKTTSSTILLQYYYDSRDFLFYVLEYHPVALAWCLPYSLIYSTLFRAPFKHHDVPFLKKIRAVLLGYLHFLENKRGMQAHTFSSLHKEPGVFRYWVSFYDPVVHTPVTQVSGLCFNKDGKILMIGSHHWNIPGGKPEVGETVEETLVREVREESNVEITHFEPLGVMMIIYPNNPNKKEGEIFYQLRFIAKIEKINTQIPDPAGGKIRKRMFVEPEKCIEYVNWGYEAERMFDSAKKLYYQKK